jgi:hypothetical protein
MKIGFAKVAILFISLVVLYRPGFASPALHEAGDQSWKFRVLLDDTPIGYHEVRINRDSNRKTVHTQASFDVRFLFIPVYTYSHETRESWEDGCLVNISSTTDDNGDNYFISSIDRSNELTIETRDGTTSIDGCVRTFAYWDLDLLQSGRLLNTQTGEYQPVSVRDLGTGNLNIDDRELEARHFRLSVEGMAIDLWYTMDMRWLALESITESGAVLRYLPDNPDPALRESRS